MDRTKDQQYDLFAYLPLIWFHHHLEEWKWAKSEQMSASQEKKKWLVIWGCERDYR